MDLSTTIAPKSDQLNAEDFIAGPRTVTITKVTGGGGEQPVSIHTAEVPDRPYKPCLTMRRLLVALWGSDGESYVGRRLSLYRDPSVQWAGEDVGGIRISHMSHIDGPKSVALTVTRNRRAPYRVEPIVDEAPASTASPKRALWERMRTLPKDAAKAFLDSAVGHDLARATDITDDEAAEVLANYDALLAAFMQEES